MSANPTGDNVRNHIHDLPGDAVFRSRFVGWLVPSAGVTQSDGRFVIDSSVALIRSGRRYEGPRPRHSSSLQHRRCRRRRRRRRRHHRLGTELVRLRSLFEHAPLGALILLDELCAGTNPSEAIEIVDIVLRLLKMLEPVAFVTTHFLDFAAERRRSQRSEDGGLGFLQADVDPETGPSYQFREGVATTSLAVGAAHRLGVEFDELRRRLNGRLR